MTKVKNSPKICGVCGDKALGRNFCAVSCESCKAFFRRNASEYERMRCHFGDNCLIDIESRSNCRKCRLKICFAIGMRKEWILNDEEKEVRKRKIQDNRQKKCNKIVDKLDDNSSLSQSMVTTDNEVSDNLFEILDNVDINEEKLNSEIKEIENSLPNDSYSNEMFTELQVIPIVRPINNNAFNETESMRFTELMSVIDFIRFPTLTITSQVQDLFDAMKMAVNKFDEICRKSVKGFKRLNAFKTLCKNDQILLLKSNGLQMTALRSMTIYDYQYKQWVVPIDDNNSTLMNLKEMDSDETLIDLIPTKDVKPKQDLKGLCKLNVMLMFSIGK
ncbi:unnamed protein product [Oppiella nova]|uniref:Nuclear receptor domain-containing protein n=1 Tax=Oppiella nova TaxID=334625 RepID=A0A7R9LEI6_9ACAR|nr:unnamed protein product [Oppiella nova]CAG2162030.1 unnamed protein product [Oppiella nova]